MSVTPILDDALQRLAHAVDKLEDVVERRLESDTPAAVRAMEMQAVAEDRSRLAQELDATLKHNDDLVRTNRDVAARLDQAMSAIRSIIIQRGQ